MNRRKYEVLWKQLPEQYFTEQLDYCAVLILRFVHMSFGLQIFLCHFSHSQHLTTALDYSQIKTSNTVLSNCNCS